MLPNNCNFDDLNSIPRTHIKVEKKENKLHTETHTPLITINLINLRKKLKSASYRCLEYYIVYYLRPKFTQKVLLPGTGPGSH